MTKVSKVVQLFPKIDPVSAQAKITAAYKTASKSSCRAMAINKLVRPGTSVEYAEIPMTELPGLYMYLMHFTETDQLALLIDDTDPGFAFSGVVAQSKEIMGQLVFEDQVGDEMHYKQDLEGISVLFFEHAAEIIGQADRLNVQCLPKPLRRMGRNFQAAFRVLKAK